MTMLLQTVMPEDATGTVATAYAAFDRAGEVPLPMQVLSASPGLQELQLAMVHNRSHPRLGFPLLSAIRYATARLRGHDACVAFNRRRLGQMGMSPEEIEALVSDNGPVALEERESALLAFVRGALVAPERVQRGGRIAAAPGLRGR